VARHKFYQAQQQNRIMLDLSRIAQQHAVAGDRKVGVRQARSPFGKISEERAIGPVGFFQRATRMIGNGGSMTVVFPHPFHSRSVLGERLASDGFLLVEIEQIPVRSCTVVQSASCRAQEGGGASEWIRLIVPAVGSTPFQPRNQPKIG
jgi:hypothetical protein